MMNMSKKALFDEKQHFGLRKFSTGLASVLLATSLMTAGHSQQVKADTTNDDHDANQQNLPENDTKDFQTQDDVKQETKKTAQSDQNKGQSDSNKNKSDLDNNETDSGSLAQDLAQLNEEANGQKTVDEDANKGDETVKDSANKNEKSTDDSIKQNKAISDSASDENSQKGAETDQNTEKEPNTEKPDASESQNKGIQEDKSDSVQSNTDGAKDALNGNLADLSKQNEAKAEDNLDKNALSVQSGPKEFDYSLKDDKVTKEDLARADGETAGQSTNTQKASAQNNVDEGKIAKLVSEDANNQQKRALKVNTKYLAGLNGGLGSLYTNLMADPFGLSDLFGDHGLINSDYNYDLTDPQTYVQNASVDTDVYGNYGSTLTYDLVVGNIAALSSTQLGHSFPTMQNASGFALESMPDNRNTELSMTLPNGEYIVLGYKDTTGGIRIDHDATMKVANYMVRTNGFISPLRFPNLTQSYTVPTMHVNEDDGKLNNHTQYLMSVPVDFVIATTSVKGQTKMAVIGRADVNGTYVRDAHAQYYNAHSMNNHSNGSVPSYFPAAQEGQYSSDMSKLVSPPWLVNDQGKPYLQILLTPPIFLRMLNGEGHGRWNNYEWRVPLHLINNVLNPPSDSDIQSILQNNIYHSLYTSTVYGSVLEGDSNQAHVTINGKTYYAGQTTKDAKSDISSQPNIARDFHINVRHYDSGGYRHYQISVRYSGNRTLYMGDVSLHQSSYVLQMPIDMNLANSQGLAKTRDALLNGQPRIDLPTYGNFVDRSLLNDLHKMSVYASTESFEDHHYWADGPNGWDYYDATINIPGTSGNATPAPGYSDNDSKITMIRQRGNYNAKLYGKPATSHLILRDRDTGQDVYVQEVHGTVGEVPGRVDVNKVNDFIKQNKYLLDKGVTIPPAIDMTDVKTPDVIILVHQDIEQRHLAIHYMDMDEGGKEVESLKDVVPLNIVFDTDHKHRIYTTGTNYDTIPNKEYLAGDHARTKGYYIVDDFNTFYKNNHNTARPQGGVTNGSASYAHAGDSDFVIGDGTNGYLPEKDQSRDDFSFGWNNSSDYDHLATNSHGYANTDIYLHVRHMTKTTEDESSHSYAITQHLPEPAMDSKKYVDVYGQDQKIFNDTLNLHRTEKTDLATNKTTYGPWTLDHYYAFDNQGNMKDLGKAEFTQNATGKWGFWNIFEQYQHSQYGVQANEIFTNIGKGPVGLPEYNMTNDNPAGGTVHFADNQSWFTIDVNSPSDIANLNNGSTNVTLNYQPTTHINKIHLKPNSDSKIKTTINFQEPYSKAMKTDSAQELSLNDITLNNKNASKTLNQINSVVYLGDLLISTSDDPVYDLIEITPTADGSSFIVNSSKHGIMYLDQYNQDAERNNWEIRNLKPVSVKDGDKLKASILTKFTVADQNVRQKDGSWAFEQPEVTLEYSDQDSAVTHGDSDDNNVRQTITVHYIIPEQVADQTGLDSDTNKYSISMHRGQYTDIAYREETEYEPIYDPDTGELIGEEPYTIEVPYTQPKDTGWYDTDSNDDDSNTVSIDDITGDVLDDDPLVYDENTYPPKAAGYHLVMYYKDASGKPVYISNSQLINDGSKHYYAPWYGQGYTEMTDRIGDYLIDPNIGNDIYVTYVADNAQKEIQYVNTADYPEGQEHVISRRTVNGPEGSEIDQQILKYMPQGYYLDTDYDTPDDIYTFSADEDNQPTKVYVRIYDDVQINKHDGPAIGHLAVKLINNSDANTSNFGFKALPLSEVGTSESSTPLNPKDVVASGTEYTETFTFDHVQKVNPITGEVDDDYWVADDPQNPDKDHSIQWSDEYSLTVPDGYLVTVDGAPVTKKGPITINPIKIEHDFGDRTITIEINNITHSQTVEFVHTNSDGSEDVLGEAGTVSGSDGQNITFNLVPPDGYMISKKQSDKDVQITNYGSDSDNSGQAIIKLNPDGHTVKIDVESPSIHVSHNDPKKSGDPMPEPHEFENYPDGIDKDDLNRTITETVEFDGPDGSSTQTQTVYFYRDAIITPSDGSVTYVDSNDSNAPLGTNWIAQLNGQNAGVRQAVITQPVSIGKIDGYTPVVQVISGGNIDYDTNSIQAIRVDPESENISIRVRYVKNATGKRVIFVDDDATMSQVGMAQEVNDNGTTLILPKGYEVSDNSSVANAINSGSAVNWSELYNQYKSDTGDDNVVVIHVHEKTQDVSATDANAKLDVKRQVVIEDPEGKITSIIVTAQMRRQAIYNEATGQTKYGAWKRAGLSIKVYVDGDEMQGIDVSKYLDMNSSEYNNWVNKGAIVIPAIRVPNIKGYAKAIDNTNTNGINLSNDYIPLEVIMTPDQAKTYKNDIGTETHHDGQVDDNNQGIDIKQNKIISVHYDPDEHEMTYIYVDVDDGMAVKGDSITGEAGETYDLENSLPDGYHLASGQSNIPSEWTLGRDEQNGSSNVTKIIYVKKNA